jgi:hypothetical protein
MFCHIFLTLHKKRVACDSPSSFYISAKSSSSTSPVPLSKVFKVRRFNLAFSDTSKIKIRDIRTGQIQTDKTIVAKAMFANIWLTSAGVKYYQEESRPGENYAFNEPAEELYNTICTELLNGCKNNGVIDTVDLLRNIENNNSYKYNSKIIVNLFRTPYQTEVINKLFLQSLGINQQLQKPETLYTMSYAGELAFGNKKTDTKRR